MTNAPDQSENSWTAANDWLLLVVVGLMIALPSLVLWRHMAVGGATQYNQAGEPSGQAPPSVPQLISAQLADEQQRLRLKALLNDYVPKHFGWRDELVHVAGIIQVEWLGISSSPRVLMGRDGWLFISEPAEIVNDIRGTAPLEPLMLQRIAGTWRYFHQQLQGRDIPLIIALVPDKASIESEHLPPWLKPRLGQRRADQVLAFMRDQAPEVTVLDLRPAVARRKAAGYPVFQKTDTHWTDHGAFAAYQALMQEARKHLPGLSILTDHDVVEHIEQRDTGGDLAMFLGLSERLPENIPRLVHRQDEGPQDIVEGLQRFRREGGSGDPDAPRLVMYRDSFAHRLIPYLNRSFGQATYFWPSAAAEYQGLIRLDLIDELGPDVVIFELTERWLTINPEAIGVLPAEQSREILKP